MNKFEDISWETTFHKLLNPTKGIYYMQNCKFNEGFEKKKLKVPTLVQRLSLEIRWACALFEENMKLRPYSDDTIRFISRCRGQSDPTP